MERTCFRWHRAYLEGRESCKLQGEKGAPVTALTKVNINTGVAMISTDPHLTIRELVRMLDISIERMHTLLKDHLHMSRVCAR